MIYLIFIFKEIVIINLIVIWLWHHLFRNLRAKRFIFHMVISTSRYLNILTFFKGLILTSVVELFLFFNLLMNSLIFLLFVSMRLSWILIVCRKELNDRLRILHLILLKQLRSFIRWFDQIQDFLFLLRFRLLIKELKIKEINT